MAEVDVAALLEGLDADQTIAVTTPAADTQPPAVSLAVVRGLDAFGQATVDLNQQARFRVSAVDNVGVVEI